MSKRKILILGGGISGLSLAWHLYRKGMDFRIFEKEPEIGGLCRSKKIGGFTFDYDGHLLHFRHNSTLRFVKNLLGSNLVKHKRNADIFSFGKFTHFPFQANLYGLPKSIVKECISGFIETHRNGYGKNKVKSFKEWINQNLGTGIARHFMIPYNTKFWTIPPQELTCEWVDGGSTILTTNPERSRRNGFIPVPSLKEVIEGAIKEGRGSLGYNAFFWYPRRGGINELPLTLASQLKNIFTNCEVTRINPASKQIRLADGSEEKFDLLFSTLPLPELPALIKDIPEKIEIAFKKLRWNSIFNINLGIEGNVDSVRHWIYFPEKEFCFFRVGFPHNFSHSAAPKGKSSIYIEIAYSQHKSIDKDNIIAQVLQDLRKSGIFKENTRIVAQDINDIKYGYPIYDFNYNEARNKILNYLARNNIISIGRYGSWRYMSIEDVNIESKLVSEKIKK